MTQYTHDTAPTQFADPGGIRFAYRRFGTPERTPIVFFQHFMEEPPRWADVLAGRG